MLVRHDREADVADAVAALMTAFHGATIIPTNRIASVFEDLRNTRMVIVARHGVGAEPARQGRDAHRRRLLALRGVLSLEHRNREIRRNAEVAAVRVATSIEVEICQHGRIDLKNLQLLELLDHSISDLSILICQEGLRDRIGCWPFSLATKS